MQREWFAALIPLALGVCFLSLGVYGLRRAKVLRLRGVTAKGRIVRHELARTEDSGKFYHPVAAWTTEDGRACEHSARFGRGRVENRFRVGANVTVRYDPRTPARFEIEGWDSTAVDRLFAVLGAVMTAGTVITVLIGWLCSL
ncbi:MULTISPECIES: DUF3592 domain-containing protein [unclassified Streptomyces]|uniref:DUF3592 domain-containing protein n=1 Tax=unclassified Streptomyces TaxID=2593676 RepID=UPI0033D24AD2